MCLNNNVLKPLTDKQYTSPISICARKETVPVEVQDLERRSLVDISEGRQHTVWEPCRSFGAGALQSQLSRDTPRHLLQQLCVDRNR
jgi:hypothetical protein